ncbi:GNAT family N-acetyltransferase [Cellulophaga sp. HaHaR_3_176]|uniref:GNAT family N-acetyltransferase n=1 Tax=Cellulophaga sp. HaHaR_3_176 TaxID=1942464 RepID=UPI001C1F4FCB|nr:GNAT family N-acetyltransferase [Cellulophaga sp. HaHaR_3_176]QWX84906.1 GNAT family N-acetyltransferase [Cellulophaga sp. HaHaR_3_176]
MIEIKKITTEETYHLRHTVMYPNLPLEAIKLPKDNKGEHFAVVKNDVIVSVVSLFFENNNAQFRKLATAVSEQGKGHASSLIKHIIEYSKKEKTKKIWCNARILKIAFYKKFGLLETTKTYSKDGFDFIILEMDL